MFTATLLGGTQHGREVPVFYPHVRRLYAPVFYRCGCMGRDVYELWGELALFVFHEPSPRHPDYVLADWNDGGPPEPWLQH